MQVADEDRLAAELKMEHAQRQKEKVPFCRYSLYRPGLVIELLARNTFVLSCRPVEHGEHQKSAV